ncbi:MAG: PIN domain-containing protein [Planctomycetes bacterium]|nr:PIN domain-containing protein [Planctomycetota bacterium]
MTPLFVDTSFYLASLSSKDSLHTRAIELGRDSRRHLTTECILWELGNALSVGRDRQLFVSFVTALQADIPTTIIAADSALMTRAIELFQKRPDKEWSLTDCASFRIMQDHGLSEALTADHHFEQAGFIALLK